MPPKNTTPEQPTRAQIAGQKSTADRRPLPDGRPVAPQPVRQSAAVEQPFHGDLAGSLRTARNLASVFRFTGSADHYSPAMQAHVDRQTGRGPEKIREDARRAQEEPIADFGPAPETKGLDAATLAVVKTLLDAGKTGLEIAEHMGVHLRTARKYIAACKGMGWLSGDDPATLPPAPADLAEAADRLFAALGRELAHVETAQPGANSDTLARITRALARVEAIRTAIAPVAPDGAASTDLETFSARITAATLRIASYGADHLRYRFNLPPNWNPEADNETMMFLLGEQEPIILGDWSPVTTEVVAGNDYADIGPPLGTLYTYDDDPVVWMNARAVGWRNIDGSIKFIDKDQAAKATEPPTPPAPPPPAPPP